jgi:ATP-dependent Clp protease ATP-binding subunit ClpC
MLAAAKQTFKPELLNRFDDVIVFRELEREDAVEILTLELAKLRERLAAGGRKLQLQKSARELLIKEGFNREHGARPLRRAIARFIEDPLAEKILRGEIEPNGTVVVTAVKGKIRFSVRKTPASRLQTGT